MELNGSASYDEDADPLTYLWTLAGQPPSSSLTDDDISGRTSRRAYLAPTHTGKHDIGIIVSDGKFQTEDTVVITVVDAPSGNLPPDANAGPDVSATMGNPVPFDGSGSSDADGDTITYSWDFGDGSAAGNGQTPTHTYANAGNYAVILTVTDTKGAQDSDTAAANIYPVSENAPPVAIITSVPAADRGTISITTGKTVDFDGSKSYDPEDQDISYSWAFGDGSSYNDKDPPAHTYGTAGTYTVTLTVTDDKPQSSGTKLSVVVAASQSTVTIPAPAADITVLIDPLQLYPVANEKTNGVGGAYDAKRNVVPVVTLTRFDLSGIPSGAKILRATLTVYVVSLQGEVGKDLISAVPASLSWSEKTTEFKGTPYSSTAIYDQATFSALGKYQFDLTKLVAEWVSGKANNGFALIPTSKYVGGFFLAAREYGKDMPVLSVTYAQ